jgi:hypothetical protein
MAYKKGGVEIKVTCDSARDYERGEYICLPHSCDNWVIGGEKEARQLIADLEELLTNLNEK